MGHWHLLALAEHLENNNCALLGFVFSAGLIQKRHLNDKHTDTRRALLLGAQKHTENRSPIINWNPFLNVKKTIIGDIANTKKKKPTKTRNLRTYQLDSGKLLSDTLTVKWGRVKHCCRALLASWSQVENSTQCRQEPVKVLLKSDCWTVDYALKEKSLLLQNGFIWCVLE